jgi:hypothetical protein
MEIAKKYYQIKIIFSFVLKLQTQFLKETGFVSKPEALIT